MMIDDRHLDALQRLIDREAIWDCLCRYSRGIDRHDEEILQSAFHPDALDRHGNFVATPEHFVPWANDLHASEWAAHTHFLGNHRVEFDDDVAHSEVYVIFALRRTDGAGIDLGGGRYIDRFERRHGEWRIAARELVMEWTARAVEAKFNDSMELRSGSRDRSDLSYQRPFAVDVGHS